MTPELTSLLEELEIKAVPLYAYRGPGATMATACLESILQQHGYGHTKLVLTSIAETRSNDRELVAPVIWAVSDLIVAHPKWADRVSDWLAAFDKVDIRHLRVFAKLNKSAVKHAPPLLRCCSDSWRRRWISSKNQGRSSGRRGGRRRDERRNRNHPSDDRSGGGGVGFTVL